MSKSNFTRRNFIRLLSAGLSIPLLTEFKARSKAKQNLKVSVPLSLASLPVRFAQSQGIFSRIGLQVELIDIVKPTDRRKLLANQRLDCIVGDVSGVLFEVINSNADLKIISTGSEMGADQRPLALLGSGYKYREVRTMQDLLSRIDKSPENSILLPRYTDIEYATDTLLSEEYGLQVNQENSQIIYTGVTDLIKSFSLLLGIGSVTANSKQVLSVVLPEPLATLAGEKNAKSNGGIIQDGQWGFDLSSFQSINLMPPVIVSRGEVIHNQPTLITSFLKAYKEAVRRANSIPKGEMKKNAKQIGVEVFRSLYWEGWEPPEGLEEIFEVPEFSQPRALEEDEFKRVLDWFIYKGYRRRQKTVNYNDVFDSSFLS